MAIKIRVPNYKLRFLNEAEFSAEICAKYGFKPWGTKKAGDVLFIPDIVRLSDQRVFEVKYFTHDPRRREGVIQAQDLLRALGQVMVLKAVFGSGGIIFPREAEAQIREINRKWNNIFDNFEVLYL